MPARLIGIAWHRDRLKTPVASAFVESARSLCKRFEKDSLRCLTKPESAPQTKTLRKLVRSLTDIRSRDRETDRAALRAPPRSEREARHGTRRRAREPRRPRSRSSGRSTASSEPVSASASATRSSSAHATKSVSSARPRTDPTDAAVPLKMGRARGVSSAGRAPALQAGGHRFDPGTLQRERPWKRGLSASLAVRAPVPAP